jgi:hypothetical protein
MGTTTARHPPALTALLVAWLAGCAAAVTSADAGSTDDAAPPTDATAPPTDATAPPTDAAPPARVVVRSCALGCASSVG